MMNLPVVSSFERDSIALRISGNKGAHRVEDLFTPSETASVLSEVEATLTHWHYKRVEPASYEIGRRVRYRALASIHRSASYDRTSDGR